jgi:TM2 domain-containing membrane protein YozV
MNIMDILLRVSSFFIVLMFIITLYGIIRIYILKPRWEIQALVLIPIMYILLYSWIGIFDPHAELSRTWARIVNSIFSGLLIPVVFSYLSELKKLRGGKNR